MAGQREYRGRVSALASIVLHAVLLAVLAGTSIQLAGDHEQILPLVIRDPAPPPPPPGGGGGPGPPAREVVARVEPPKMVDQPRPIEAPKPEERPRIAAKPPTP